MNRLLVVEDDANLALNLKKYLTHEGYQVHVAPTIREAEKKGYDFDLIILDWMLPDGQGIDFLRAIRKQNQEIPILLLTAKADLVDKVLGLESGANDYIVKPFEPREILARLRVQLRKVSPVSDTLQACGLVLNTKSREVKYKGKLIETTRKEFDLLALLLTHPNRVFSREELLNQVWGFENYPTTRTVDTHVLQLRQKISDDLIQTVRGIGYRLKNDEKLT